MLKILKKLAKSNKWQAFYSRTKEIGTLKLFKNDSDLSYVQQWFLYLLEMYYQLYQDLAMEKEYISEEIINDDLRCEAYLLLRKEMNKKDKNKKNNEKKINTSGDIPSVIFRGKD